MRSQEAGGKGGYENALTGFTEYDSGTLMEDMDRKKRLHHCSGAIMSGGRIRGKGRQKLHDEEGKNLSAPSVGGGYAVS